MAKRLSKSLADYVTIAISPALIIAMVGSLLFFLLEAAYAGQYELRLKIILFAFAVAVVLIARISLMGEIAHRAPIYGAIMGLATALCLYQFVEYPEGSPLVVYAWPINLGIMAIVWFSAHMLTRDCTLIDDTEDATGEGLLQVVGLERPDPGEAVADPEPPKREKKISLKSDFWKMFTEAVSPERKKARVPGVWIVYFSLAALPLFGLGQLLIPPDETGRRVYAFALLCVYVACGLGLLLCTSFLGLRRYLRQRKLQMPKAMTGAWMAIGGILILVLLFFCALIPRPNPDHSQPLAEAMHWLAGKDGDAQKGQGKDPGKAEGDPKAPGNDGKPSTAPGGNATAPGGSAPGGKNGNQGNGGKGDGGKGDGDGKKQGGQGQSKPPEPPSAPNLDWLGTLFKWLAIAVVVLAVAYGLIRLLARSSGFFAGLLAAIHDLWASLFGWLRRRERTAKAESEEAAKPPTDIPFLEFVNPFEGGAPRRSPDELMRYTFAALEAWTRDHRMGRRPDETPLEFVERLGDSLPRIAALVQRLGQWYALCLYARQPAAADCLPAVRELWNHMTLAREPVPA